MEEEKEEPKEEPQAPQPPVAMDMIEKANLAALRLEEANKDLKNLLAQQEAQRVEEVLGGATDAGKQEKSEEDKAIEDARGLLAGTGYDDQLFPKDKK